MDPVSVGRLRLFAGDSHIKRNIAAAVFNPVEADYASVAFHRQLIPQRKKAAIGNACWMA